jgi:3-dehydroquinate synthase class II
MFGPVDAYLAESEAGDAVTIYRLNGEELSAVQRKLV